MPEQSNIINRSAIGTRFVPALIVLTSVGLLLASLLPAGPPTQAQSTMASAKQPVVGQNCVSCHRTYVQSFGLEIHGKTARFLSDSRAATCEACHGDGAKHIENREKRIAADDIDNPAELKTKEARTRANDKCLMCHRRDRSHFEWSGGEHDRKDMSCLSCHTVHHVKLFQTMSAGFADKTEAEVAELISGRLPEHMLSQPTIEETCLTCHSEQRKALFQRSTHLFRTEVGHMKVGCASCHNPHGGEAGKMLREHTVNNVCYTCHAEKRGPFLWDHPPVRENCLNCHSPHGANNPKLLNARAHLVCQQCHIHMLPRHSTTAGQPLDIWSINRGCMNCHAQVHGSNHPGGRTLTR